MSGREIAGAGSAQSSPEAVAVSRAMGKRYGIGFGATFGSEALVIAVAANVLGAFQQYDYIVPMYVLVIGLHFLPLAWLFQVPAYYVTGALLSLVAILTVLVIPRSSMVNQAPLWLVVPAAGSAVVLWLTAVMLLTLGRRATRPAA